MDSNLRSYRLGAYAALLGFISCLIVILSNVVTKMVEPTTTLHLGLVAVEVVLAVVCLFLWTACKRRDTPYE